MDLSIKRICDNVLTQRVEAMEHAIGNNDWYAAAEHFTANVRYQVAHRSPYFGASGIRDYMTWQYSLVQWEGHDVRSRFSLDNVVFIEVNSHFSRLQDGAKLIVPCTDVYTFEDDKIADWRVYADTSVFDGW